MRCYICDVELGESEIQVGEDGKSEPCTTCMKVIMDTAYCDGFTPEGKEVDDEVHLLDEEIG